MHIIFGDAVKEIPNSYTILELDTFKKSDGTTATAFCVVEKIPLAEFSTLDAHKTLHSNLIKYYREKQWDYCEQAISALIGKWNGELDSFYTNMLSRISQYKITEPDQHWDGSLIQ
jgi:hypothetical protein